MPRKSGFMQEIKIVKNTIYKKGKSMKVKTILKTLITVCATVALAAVTATVAIPQKVSAAGGEKTADVFLIAGQSNAAGSTRVDSTPYGYAVAYTPTENVLFYGGNHKTVDGGVGRYLTDFRPVQHGCGYTDNHVGFELGMANVLNVKPEYSGPDKKAIIFKSAAGGTSVFPEGNYNRFGNWYPKSLWEKDYYKEDYFNPIGFQYRTFMTVFEEFLEAAKNEGFGNIEIKGLFWMQGESDRNNGEEYFDVCTALFNDFRADISEITGKDYSNLPIYEGEISSTFASASADSVETNLKFIETQHKIADSMRNVYVAPLKDYLINEFKNGQSVVVGSDSSHWNYTDIVAVGEQFANLYDRTYGKIDGYVNLNVTGPETALGKSVVDFKGELGPNYASGTEKVEFSVKTAQEYTVKAITAQGATLTPLGKHYEEGEIVPVYDYELTSLDGDVSLNVEYAANKVYRVTSTTADKTYGSAPSVKVIKNAYSGCKYVFKTYPTSSGAVYKFIINGVEVYGQKDVVEYTFDDWEEKYMQDAKTLNIEIVYGERNEVNALLDQLDNPPKEDSGSDKGGSCASAVTPVSLLTAVFSLAAAAFICIKRR